MAVAERQPTPGELLVELDLGRGATPAAALALVLPPPYVWSYDEARAAGAAAAGRPDPDVWLRVIEEVGAALIRRAHEERVLALAGRVAAELPFQRHRRVSRTLADACARVAREPDFRRGVAALTLAAYVRAVAGYVTFPN